MNFKQNACVNKTLFRLLMAMLLLALLAGCGGNRNLNKLPDILSSYEAALRWNGARAAMAFVSPDNHPAETRHGVHSQAL